VTLNSLISEQQAICPKLGLVFRPFSVACTSEFLRFDVNWHMWADDATARRSLTQQSNQLLYCDLLAVCRCEQTTDITALVLTTSFNHECNAWAETTRWHGLQCSSSRSEFTVSYVMYWPQLHITYINKVSKHCRTQLMSYYTVCHTNLICPSAR